MLTRKELTDIAKEARDFADLADAVIAEADAQPHWNPTEGRHMASKSWYQHGGTALTGMFRRRSMDLSRSLTELRKP